MGHNPAASASLTGLSQAEPKVSALRASIPGGALNFRAIEAKCMEIAARSNVSVPYALSLRHIAADCRCALDGCEASAESVELWLESDRLLDAELGNSQWLPDEVEITRPAESYIPVVRAA